jgi:hypothetical protein
LAFAARLVPALSRTEETLQGEIPAAAGRSESAPVEPSADSSAGFQDSNGPRDKEPRPAQTSESLQAHRRREQGAPTDEGKPVRDTTAAQNAGALTAPPLSRSAETTQPLDTKEAASSTRPAELRESEPVLRTAASSAAPARDISLRISGDANERVELRVTDRAGEVRVAVRTGDSDLAGSLREHLPELVNRLERSGFAAETWRPAQAGSASFDQRSGQRGTEGEAFAGSQHGHPGEGKERGQQQQQQRDRARWVEEIEKSVTPASERTPWLQR